MKTKKQRGDSLKAIIFDMDGVIINSEPLHFKIEKELLEELGGNISDEELQSFAGTTDYNMWSKFKEMFKLKPPVEELVETKKERFMKRIDEVDLVDNFMDFMLAAYEEGFLLAIASSNNRRIVDAVVEKFQLGKYMQFIISGEEVKKGKPDPEIFLTAAKKMNVSPTDCIVIEDATNGVKAAKAAGMKCIALKNLDSGNQDLSEADLIIKNFKELNLDIIKSLLNKEG